MNKLMIASCFALLLMTGPAYSQEGNSSNKQSKPVSQKTANNPKKQDLYSRWKKIRKDDPAAAFQIVKEYFNRFPDDKSKNALTLKRWLEDYEKTAKKDSVAVTNSTANSIADPPAKTIAARAAGTWTIVVTTKQGDLQFTLFLTQSGENLSGSVQSPYGNGTVSSGKIAENVINLDVQSDPLEVKLKGTIDGDRMKGTVTANTPNIPELPFTGTRSN